MVWFQSGSEREAGELTVLAAGQGQVQWKEKTDVPARRQAESKYSFIHLFALLSQHPGVEDLFSAKAIGYL